MNNRLAVIAALAALVSTPALAADIAMKAPAYKAAAAPYNWSGWYAGGNIGFGFGASSDHAAEPIGGFGPYFAAGGNVTPT